VSAATSNMDGAIGVARDKVWGRSRSTTAVSIRFKLNALWRFLRARAGRVNRRISDAENDDRVFQAKSWEKKLIEQKESPASPTRDAQERAN
jgi:hypothetical protein